MKSDLNEVAFSIAHATAPLVACEIEKALFKGSSRTRQMPEPSPRATKGSADNSDQHSKCYGRLARR